MTRSLRLDASAAHRIVSAPLQDMKFAAREVGLLDPFDCAHLEFAEVDEVDGASVGGRLGVVVFVGLDPYEFGDRMAYEMVGRVLADCGGVELHDAGDAFEGTVDGERMLAAGLVLVGDDRDVSVPE